MQNKIIEEAFPETLKILAELIKFQTVSGSSNIELIEYCEEKLSKLGAESFKTFDDKKLRANLFSTINGKKKLNGGGIILSGHTDVVPASTKDWASNPYIASERNNKVFDAVLFGKFCEISSHDQLSLLSLYFYELGRVHQCAAPLF